MNRDMSLIVIVVLAVLLATNMGIGWLIVFGAVGYFGYQYMKKHLKHEEPKQIELHIHKVIHEPIRPKIPQQREIRQLKQSQKLLK